MTVCPDASVILKCLTYEPGTDSALEWLHAHRDDEMVAPVLLPIEVASVLRQKTRRREMTHEEAQEALDILESLNIKIISDSSLVRRAFELSVQLDLPAVYDALYLAVAERSQCDLWTADARFQAVASEHFAYVRLLKSSRS